MPVTALRDSSRADLRRRLIVAAGRVDDFFADLEIRLQPLTNAATALFATPTNELLRPTSAPKWLAVRNALKPVYWPGPGARSIFEFHPSELDERAVKAVEAGRLVWELIDGLLFCPTYPETPEEFGRVLDECLRLEPCLDLFKFELEGTLRWVIKGHIESQSHDVLVREASTIRLDAAGFCELIHQHLKSPVAQQVVTTWQVMCATSHPVEPIAANHQIIDPQAREQETGQRADVPTQGTDANRDPKSPSSPIPTSDQPAVALVLLAAQPAPTVTYIAAQLGISRTTLNSALRFKQFREVAVRLGVMKPKKAKAPPTVARGHRTQSGSVEATRDKLPATPVTRRHKSPS